MGLLNRLKSAWNVFFGYKDGSENETIRQINYTNLGPGSYYRPDKIVYRYTNDKSIVNAIYNRIAIDVASLVFKHVRLDNEGRYVEDIDSGLNNCLTLEANIDQNCKAFMMDIVMSMFDEGNIAVLPIDTDDNPSNTEGYDILTLRTARIIQWFPKYVQLEVYNDRTGNKETIYVDKEKVAIIENPLYAIMNEPNSTLQRLIHKLNLLDMVDDQSSSGKLDLIIQLPYVIKTEARKQQASERRQEIEDQLNGSKYGIAYTDGTEKIIQLNRPIDNNLMKSVEFLTSTLKSQLGVTDDILNGTAKEEEMLNYITRTIKPIADSIALEMKRKFLTKTARTQKQTIMYFNNPFDLVPVNQIAEIADKFTRNEILSSNEVRQIVGMKPVNDPKADELRNKNLNEQVGQEFASTNEVSKTDTRLSPETKLSELETK